MYISPATGVPRSTFGTEWGDSATAFYYNLSNGYIRGVALRFLCRICEAEIIEPLIPSILANLEHQLPFVRRNAILAVSAIYKLPKGDQLLVDAPEMIEKVLTTETDQLAKRNAFLMLCTCAQDNAVNYLLTNVKKSVIFECARTLVSLSSAPIATRAAANACCKLLLNQSQLECY
nr:coatomer subunit beta-1-like [Tanacetum cinerariifolium]